MVRIQALETLHRLLIMNCRFCNKEFNQEDARVSFLDIHIETPVTHYEIKFSAKDEDKFSHVRCAIIEIVLASKKM